MRRIDHINKLISIINKEHKIGLYYYKQILDNKEVYSLSVNKNIIGAYIKSLRELEKSIYLIQDLLKEIKK